MSDIQFHRQKRHKTYSNNMMINGNNEIVYTQIHIHKIVGVLPL